MKSEENLRNAIRQIPISDYADDISDILYESLNSNSDIPYEHIRRLAGKNTEDVILIASERRLIIPEGKDLSWKSSEYLFKFKDEKYDIPGVVREAAKRACETGTWEPEYAIHAYFKRIKEPLGEVMPDFFAEIKQNARYGKIRAKEIKCIASRFGTEDRIGVLIAELKAAGLINPHFSFALGLKEKDVTYEVNPCF